MKELLKFVDDYVFETQLYFRVWSLYNKEEYEVQWLHGASKHWRLKTVSAKDWSEVETDQLINFMNAAKLNLSDFEAMLSTKVLQQAAYAETFLRRAKKLFGQEVIDEAVQANKDFIQELQGTILQLLNKEPKHHTLDSDIKTPPQPVKLSREISVGTDSGKDLQQRRTLQPKDGNRSKSFLRLLGEGSDFTLEPRGSSSDS